METFIIAVFILGYAAIASEQWLKWDKAAVALLTGVLCWTLYFLAQADTAGASAQLGHHLQDIAGILFFLMGALIIVELIDSHDGFSLIASLLRTNNKRRLLWTTGLVTFFLSAALDNLTTAVVMTAVLRKLVTDKNDRMLFAGMTVIAANAGGAFSPIGDVTTTMLWIGERITAWNIIAKLFIPSLTCLIVPLAILSFRLHGQTGQPHRAKASRKKNIVFFTGMAGLMLVPLFRHLTGLPPFMGVMAALSIVWLTCGLLPADDKEETGTGTFSAATALQRLDVPSLLFFFGILLAVAVLDSMGTLVQLAGAMERAFGSLTLSVLCIGLSSAVVDNVPLVAGTMGMYPLPVHAADSYLWEFIAYCTGTGGSVLIIGSAAGITTMSMEKIGFWWYLKKIGWVAALGYFAGALVYITEHALGL